MRKVLKWLAAGVAGLVVAVGAYGVWNTYSSYRAELTGYKGLRWGDSQAEVRYALGMPTNVHYKEQPSDPGYDERLKDFYRVLRTDYSVAGTADGLPKGKTIEDYVRWSYGDAAAYTLVEFNDSRAVDRVTCYAREGQSFLSKCGRTLGLYGDEEARFVEAFGEPTRSSIDTPSGVKTSAWDQLGMEVRFTMRTAYSVDRYPPIAPDAVAYLWNWYF